MIAKGLYMQLCQLLESVASNMECTAMITARDRLLLVAGGVLFSVAIASLASAQNESCLHRTLPISIHDSQGRLLRGLVPSDLEAKLHGQPVKILSVSPDVRPHRIVVMLDAGSSMLGVSQTKKWVLATSIASSIAQTDLQSASLALLVFSDKVKEQITFSQEASAAASRLKEIAKDPSYAKKNVRGTTALGNAILSGQSLLGDPSFSDSLYLISDGLEKRSNARFRQLREGLLRNKVRLYAALLAPERGYKETVEEENVVREVSGLAVATGGLILLPIGNGPLGKANYELSPEQQHALEIKLDSLYLAMTRNDLIGIELPQAVDKWTSWSLELSPEERQTQKEWTIAYPQELAPCSALSH